MFEWYIIRCNGRDFGVCTTSMRAAEIAATIHLADILGVSSVESATEIVAWGEE